jgi:predicted nucleic acid-binding protein
MNARFLIDTNVAVYGHDRSEPLKQQQARPVLDRLSEDGLGVLSTQVLNEFFVSVTRRIAVPLSHQEAYQQLGRLAGSFAVLEPGQMACLEAARAVCQYQLHYYDALIWATARCFRLEFVLSEDFSDRRTIEGVTTINPFRPDFRLEDWLS